MSIIGANYSRKLVDNNYYQLINTIIVEFYVYIVKKEGK